MLKISFTNAEVSDHGYGLEVNGKSLSVIDGTLKISVKKNRYGINNKEVLMIWEVNTGYLKPLLSENPEESTEDKKDDKPDGEQDKGGEKDYGF